MSFTTSAVVRFGQVDAAGILFYPRYFELLNAAVEDWFAHDLGVDFKTLHISRRLGVPTVKLDCTFTTPSALGDQLDITISVERVGDASCTIGYLIGCGGVDRLRGQAVLVCMNLDEQRAVSWPDDLRSHLLSDNVTA